MSAPPEEIRRDPTLGGRLIIEKQGDLVESYAPFENVQLAARVVLVRVTPGALQTSDALASARMPPLLYPAVRSTVGDALFSRSHNFRQPRWRALHKDQILSADCKPSFYTIEPDPLVVSRARFAS